MAKNHRAPFRMFRFCFPLVGLATGLLTACASRMFGEESGAENQQISVSSTSTFLTGLSAPFGSTERIASGKMLRQELSSLRPSSTRNFLDMTAQYLESTTSCDPNSRIRLYRGMGGQPLLRDPKMPLDKIGNPAGGQSLPPGPGVNLLPDGLKRIAQNLKAQGLDFGGAKDPGAALYAQLGNVNLSLTSFLDLPSTMGSRPIDNVALSHTVTSKSSPFHSTTLLESIAVRFAGAGKSKVRYIALDICPQRAFPVSNSSALITFNEAEVYVPLFLLPEEIVGVVDCSASQDASSCRVVAGNVTPAAKGSGTSAFRACYFNYDTPYENERAVLFKWTPPHYQKNVFPQFVSTMSKLSGANAVSDYEKFLNGLEKGSCASSCVRSDDFWARHSLPQVLPFSKLAADYEVTRQNCYCPS